MLETAYGYCLLGIKINTVVYCFYSLHDKHPFNFL